jgi:hypothetical protein
MRLRTRELHGVIPQLPSGGRVAVAPAAERLGHRLVILTCRFRHRSQQSAGQTAADSARIGRGG